MTYQQFNNSHTVILHCSSLRINAVHVHFYRAYDIIRHLTISIAIANYLFSETI